MSRSINSFFLDNLGCAKNQVDAEELIFILESRGLVWTDNPACADLIIVNSCGFIEPAKKESLETLFEYRALFPDKRIILAGCLSQRYAGQMDLPEADALFGNGRLTEITSVIDDLEAGLRPVCRPEASVRSAGRSRLLTFPGSAYLKIAEGCDNRCSFCAIPLIRGDVRSREIDDIVREFVRLVDAEVIEINLIAQDLASFGIDRTPGGELVALLRVLSAQPGRFLIRLLYIHPDRFPRELLTLMKDDPRILPYFDLPFQHASASILASMGRKSDSEKNLATIACIRDSLPHAVVRSTFLLGYPGETEEDLEVLLNFQQRARFEWLGSFVYSTEEGTRAAALAGAGSRKTMKTAEKYRTIIEDAQTRISGEQLERFCGTEMDLLVEEEVPGEDLYICRGYPHAPEVDGAVVLHSKNLVPGSLIRARIVRRNGFDLEAFPC